MSRPASVAWDKGWDWLWKWSPSGTHGNLGQGILERGQRLTLALPLGSTDSPLECSLATRGARTALGAGAL